MDRYSTSTDEAGGVTYIRFGAHSVCVSVGQDHAGHAAFLAESANEKLDSPWTAAPLEDADALACASESFEATSSR